MPGFDRTGPTGRGPMTGRGMGPCGGGMARGFRRGFVRPVELSKEEQVKILEAEKDQIEKELKELKK